MVTTSRAGTPAGPVAQTPAAGRRLPGKALFFLAVLALLVGYTEMAFHLRWLTSSGQIGPGFFPRITGVLSVLIALWAVWYGWRHPGDEESVEDEVGDGDLGRYPGAMVVVVGASVVLLGTLVWLGAVLAPVIFVFGVLSYLNPRRWVTNAVLGLAVPLGMYLLFQTALNAGLPAGILPPF